MTERALQPQSPPNVRSPHTHDVYLANFSDVTQWGGTVTAADSLGKACRQRGLRTLTIGVSASAPPVRVTAETTQLNVPTALPGGLWRVRHWTMDRMLRRHLRRLPPPALAFIASSPFWVVAAKRVWPEAHVIYRFSCLLANCLPFTWPGRRPPSLWIRLNFAAVRRAEHLAFSLADQTLVPLPENRAEVLAFHPATRGPVTPAYFDCPTPRITDRMRRETRRDIGADDGEFVILAVGVVDLNKGFDWAIRELPAVDRAGRLVIVGDGPQRESLERLANELHVADRVHFVGVQRDMAPWNAAADCTISTSFYDACPNVIREAMKCARPVLVPEHDPPEVYSALGETIRRESAGLRYDRQKPGALAERLNGLVRDHQAAAELGARGQAVVRRLFDWGISLEQMLSGRPARTSR